MSRPGMDRNPSSASLRTRRSVMLTTGTPNLGGLADYRMVIPEVPTYAEEASIAPKMLAQAQSRTAKKAMPELSKTNARVGAKAGTRVNAALLKKRQSVSVGTFMQDNRAMARARHDPMPSLPSVSDSFAAAPSLQNARPIDGPRPPSAGSSSKAMALLGIGQPTGSTGLPASTSSSSLSRQRAAELDVSALHGDHFDAQAFLKDFLATEPPGTELDSLKRAKIALLAEHASTSTELQKTVLNNYSDFITVSKEVTTLENDLLELKSALEDWRGVPESLEVGVSFEAAQDSSLIASIAKRGQRNSIVDLQAVYRSQLEALWETVEGSRKYLPPTPNRHLMHETSAFTEVDPATYRTRQPVHLVLLNDALLIAVQKRRQMGGRVRLVAERSFALNEISVADLKDATNLQNAVKIKRGKETVIFRAPKLEDKRVLLAAFKKIQEEITSRRRNDSAREAQARKEQSDGRAMSLEAFVGLAPSTVSNRSATLPNGEPAWVGDIGDDLSVKIALREFDEAVSLIENCKGALAKAMASKQDAPFMASLVKRLDARTADLVTTLESDLSSQEVSKTKVVKSCGWLLRLQEGERAQEAFLAGRAKLVKRRIRQIAFEGDIRIYIVELAIVVFTLIKNTCEWYMAAFPDHRVASGFVRWATQQIEVYAEVFRRQVYGADQEASVIEASKAETKKQGAMLRDVGLDFGFMLDSKLLPETAPAARDDGLVRRRRADTIIAAQKSALA
ncbi:uncharacterized protein L969DRAFT_21958 [Mixia osmundae IAM 14324]|uniref:Exocyst complex component EXO84 n=1 Tax=Mixia osmundae (strain CBS 9802 / IAM 14324 / JCM 22182 / KY 12970) TaxID=764103 RepID=G7DXT8_MIXOS|nr:uncharacterized protein L969DRAFT_21958 [Mixia osmundae IAM 14324]KEI41301.1 hypothetical protein L969DRAFT_21958 [Mixia osmundae IAM 14324]GAA95398.1 hypothetical protein E5Q_02052 [Mixia osmundae IAM 14324]